MVKDEVATESKNKEIVEILVDNLWIPVMATDLRIMNRDAELVRVKAIRVRELK